MPFPLYICKRVIQSVLSLFKEPIIIPLNAIRIERTNILHQSILYFLIGMIPLTGERAKHPIPNDQHPGIVLVNAKRVPSVMYAVI